VRSHLLGEDLVPQLLCLPNIIVVASPNHFKPSLVAAGSFEGR